MPPPSTQAVSNQLEGRSAGRASASRVKAAIAEEGTITPDRCLGVDHSGCCGNPGRQRGPRAGYLGEVSAADGEHRDELHPGPVDEQVLAVRGQPGVEVESGALG